MRSPLLVALMDRVTDHYARTAEKPTVVVVTEAQLRYLDRMDGHLADMRKWWIPEGGVDTPTLLRMALDVERVEVWDERQMLDLRGVTDS